MCKISIIIPVYNVEKYLEKCLNSIMVQTLQEMEIICINDGSTDNSAQILDKLALTDNRIKVFHCENKGAGEARNFGFEKSTGEFVLFFDSDDYIEKKDALEILYKKAIETSSEIVICKSQLLEQETQEINEINYSIKQNLLNNKESFSPQEIAPCIFQFCVGWPWDKLYKADFIRKNNLQFQNLRHSNDTYFVLMSLVLANKISILEKSLIIHRNHNKSLANTRIKEPNCFYFALEKLYNELKRSNLYDIYQQSFINFCLSFSLWHINSIKDKKTKNIMIKCAKKIMQMINFNSFDINYFYDKSLYYEFYALLNIKKYLKYYYLLKYKIFKNKFDLFKYYKNMAFANLHQLLENNKETICFWGASIFLEEFLKQYKIEPNVIGIIDKSPTKIGEKLNNIKIFSPNELGILNPQKIILTIKNNNDIILNDIQEFIQENHLDIKLEQNIFK